MMYEVGVPDSPNLSVQRKRNVLSPDRLKAKKILSQNPTGKLQKTKGLVNIFLGYIYPPDFVVQIGDINSQPLSDICMKICACTHTYI